MRIIPLPTRAESAFTDRVLRFVATVISPAPHQPFEVVERKLRDLQPAEVLIRVHASGICNSDHFVHEGSWPGLSYPLVPGHEVIGRIAAVGSELKDDMRLKEGSLVGVGWNGGWCGRCEWCRKGQFSYCVKGEVTGFTRDGGHAEYMYAPETCKPILKMFVSDPILRPLSQR